MEWKSGVIFILFVVTFLLINTAVVEAKKKQHKFDGDFEFADEVRSGICKFFCALTN